MKCQDGWDAFVLPLVLAGDEGGALAALSPIGDIPDFETSPMGEVLPPNKVRTIVLTLKPSPTLLGSLRKKAALTKDRARD